MKVNRAKIMNSEGVFVDLGVTELGQMLDTELSYPGFGDIQFYDGERWVNARLATTGGVTAAYDAQGRQLVLSKGA